MHKSKAKAICLICSNLVVLRYPFEAIEPQLTFCGRLKAEVLVQKLDPEHPQHEVSALVKISDFASE